MKMQTRTKDEFSTKDEEQIRSLVRIDYELRVMQLFDKIVNYNYQI